jgi:predicted membrane chloride channel (bestrophin family)
MIGKKFHWLKLAFQLKGSILSAIYKKMLWYIWIFNFSPLLFKTACFSAYF